MRAGLPRAVAGLTMAAFGLLPTVVMADAPERYQPILPQSLPAKAVTVETMATGDDTPIGPALSALVVSGTGGDGLTRITGGDQINVAGQPFIGKPISPRLIGEVLSAVTRQYGLMGHPAVAEWVPEAGLGSGVLTIRVTNIVVGDVTVKGANAQTEAYLKRRLTLKGGQTFDSRRFANDIDNLNKYPFRQIEAIFRSNAETKTSDLDLNVTEQKPWELYFGYKYTGSKDFTWRRYVAGGSFGNFLGRDSVVAFQAVMSPDFVQHGKKHPKFKDLTVTYVIPVSRRGQFEASVDDGELNFNFNGTIYRFVDLMTAWGYRQDITDHYPAGSTADIRFGVEAKNEQGNVLTGGVISSRSSAEVYQGYFGYHAAFDKVSRHTDIDLIAHLSPGGMGSGNTSAHFDIYSDGRVRSAKYAYVNLTYELTQSFGDKLVWHNQMIGQWATDPIPYSEQAGLGAPGLVRGYHLFDGSFDSALVVRNELGWRNKPGSQALPSPYFITDIGIGRDIAFKKTLVIASMGLGVRLQLTKVAALRLEATHGLRNGEVTLDGTDELGANLMFKF